MTLFFLIYCGGALITLLTVDHFAEYKFDKVNALSFWHITLIVTLWPFILLSVLFGALTNYLTRQ